jgi:hypothetical protein
VKAEARRNAHASLLDALGRVDPALERLRRDFERTKKLARQVRDAKAAGIPISRDREIEFALDPRADLVFWGRSRKDATETQRNCWAISDKSGRQQ